MLPAWGRTMPVTARIMVVLPAPFGPIRPSRGALRDVESDIGERIDAAEAHRDAGNGEERIHCLRSYPAVRRPEIRRHSMRIRLSMPPGAKYMTAKRRTP